MATDYGNRVSGSSGGKYSWRSVLIVTQTGDTATTRTFSVTGQFDTEYGIRSYANGSVSGGGKSDSFSGSTRDLGGGAAGQRTFASYSVTVSKGNSSKTVSFKARFQVTGGFGNGTSTASLSVTVPAIDYSAPYAPSGCSARIVSDTQAKASWDNGSTSTTRPRSSTKVERQTDTGSWAQVASLSSSAENYTDNGVRANRRYRYRVRAYGKGGYSSYSTSGYVYTTPAPPSKVTAVKDTATTVSVSIEGEAPWAEGYEISREADGAGDWEVVADSVTDWPWVDSSAPAGTVRYRVQSFRGARYSANTVSNAVTTITPPLAPSVALSPAGSVLPTGTALAASWAPNHPDGSAQSSAQVEYTVGSADPVTADVSGAATSYALPASATEDAGTVSVRVRTHGLDEDWGAWSEPVSVSVQVPPSVAITSPDVDGAVVEALPLLVAWEAEDATGVASQSAYLLDADGRTLASVQLDGSARTWQIDESVYALANLSGYSLRVTVRGGSSLSSTAEREFSTDWAEPAAPTAFVEYDEESLSAAVTAMAGEFIPNLWVNPAGSSYGITATAGDGQHHRATHAYASAHRIDERHKRICHVDGGKPVVADIVANEKAVHDGIEPRERERHHGRQHKPQKLFQHTPSCGRATE